MLQAETFLTVECHRGLLVCLDRVTSQTLLERGFLMRMLIFRCREPQD